MRRFFVKLWQRLFWPLATWTVAVPDALQRFNIGDRLRFTPRGPYYGVVVSVFDGGIVVVGHRRKVTKILSKRFEKK